MILQASELQGVLVKYDEIGRVKSKASKREVPLGPETVSALRRWKEHANGDLVFPNKEGTPWSYKNIWNRFWVPLLNRASLTTDNPASKTVRTRSKAQAEYKEVAFGLHMLRHVYASLMIEHGVSPKLLQKLMGHSTLKLTMDTYGHLWPDDEADQARATAVESLLAASR